MGKNSWERICGIFLNLLLLTCVLVCVYHYNYKLYGIRLCVLAHTALTLSYLYFIPNCGYYTKIQGRRSTNPVVLLTQYFIITEYNYIYTTIYLGLKNRKGLNVYNIVLQLPFVIYRMFQVLVLGMPYKLIVLCKILIKPIYNNNTNPYNIFICNLNGLIIDAAESADWCIYINQTNISVNGTYKLYYNQLAKYNQNLVWVRSPGDKVYHRAWQLGNEYIVYTTQEKTFGFGNVPTGHLSSTTHQPIYANRNKYEGIEIKVCNLQYGHNHSHSMMIQLFNFERRCGTVNTIHHNGKDKMVVSKAYNQYIGETTNSYAILINNILDTNPHMFL